MAESVLRTKGQITIPVEIRRHLKLKPGGRIQFFVEPDGKVVLVPHDLDIRALKGMLGPAPRRVSLEEMKAAVRTRRAQRGMRGIDRNRH
jgi:antitoxin PrlF